MRDGDGDAHVFPPAEAPRPNGDAGAIRERHVRANARLARPAHRRPSVVTCEF